MRGEGLKPSVLALNSLINAFGEDRREAEAFAVLRYMKENVCLCPQMSSSMLIIFSNFVF